MGFILMRAFYCLMFNIHLPGLLQQCYSFISLPLFYVWSELRPREVAALR